jgi:hypothetical protein
LNAESEVQAGGNLCFSASETEESLPLFLPLGAFPKKLLEPL